ncbi:MAG: DUF3108 domain-containing protein [Burkholderiales bacterium]|nr:DUF3108 domain-containing protein [Burkholderiales bacterium]
MPVLPRPGLPLRPARWRPALGVLLAALLLHALVAGLWPRPRPLPGAQALAAPALQVRRVQTLVLPAPPAPATADPAPADPARAEPPGTAPAVPRPAPPAGRLLAALAAASAPAAPQAWPDAAPAAPPSAPPGALPREALPGPAAEAPTEPHDAEGELAPPPVAGTAEAAPPPLYATRLPPPAQLDFVLRRGALGGRARLSWRPDGQHYTLDFDARVAGLPLIEQHSQGALDAHGLAPERFTDKRRGRAAQAAHFRRDTGRITFSGPRIEHPAWPGAQDRLGWVVQLAAIHAASESPPAEVTLFVAGARGGAGLWTFRSQGLDTVQTPLGPVTALLLRREPSRPEDLRAEIWLDPARGHWPVRIRTAPARGGEALDLLLAAEPSRP